MELLQLRYFLDSAHFGSITRTAEKHMVPPSSVSAAIRRLEQELGQRLFDRSSNRIFLNSNGQKLLRTLERVFSELDQTVNDIVYPPDEQVIRLLVRSRRNWVTDCIIEYQNEHPSVNFYTSLNYNEDAFADFDIILGPEDPRYVDYTCFELCRCRVYLRVDENHPLYGRELTLRQLKDQPFVTMGGHLHDIIVSACQRAGFMPNVVATVNDITCYQKLLHANMAIGHVRAFDRNAAATPHLNVTDFTEYQTIYAYYKDSPTGNIKSFLEFLKNRLS